MPERRPSFKHLSFRFEDVLRGSMIYAAGDTAAALLAGEFSVLRLLGILLIGGTVYAFEIPNYFNWIDRRVQASGGFQSALQRALLAMAYFNPLWIARHILFIKLFQGEWAQIGWGLLATGLASFLVNIPISLLANLIIQNKIPLRWRFVASAVFSALMAVYYALSAIWFRF